MSAPSLQRALSAPLLALVGLVLVVGLSGGLGVAFATSSIEDVTNRVVPLAQANAAVLQDLTDAETGVRGYGLSGQEVALEPYRAGLARLPDDQARLRELAEDDAELLRLVHRQERAAEEWLDDYARIRVGRQGGDGTFDPELFEVGKARFDAVREVNARIDDHVAAERRAAQDAARRRLWATVGAIAAVTVVALAASWWLARRLRARALPPLEDLEKVARRLAAGEHEARARVEGPREIRHVALALNALAEESSRARQTEAAVQAEIQSLDAARGDFVSNVSHELRTPLTTIAGYLELVEDEFGGRLDQRQRQMLDAVDRNVVRLRTLVEDLLTLSRAENSSTDLEQLDLRPVLRDVTGDLGIAADRRGIVLEVDLPEEPAVVLGDRGQLHRVFLNLVGNAVKFSHEGGQVCVRLTVAGEDAVVEVVDDGIGIPADELGEVGSRFFRASNARAGQLPGTGLGLRITQTIVRNHGGHLRLESEEGRGTRAEVTLPLTAR